MLRLYCVLIVLYGVSELNPCVCLATEKLDFQTFRHLNRENYEQIRTGMISMRYKQYQFIPRQLLQEELERARATRERTKARFLQDPNLSDYQRSDLVRQVEEAFQHELKRLSASERKMDLYRTFTFDLSAQKCRLEEEPAEPNASEPVFQDSSLYRIVITSKDGTQLSYNTHAQMATINKISVPTVRLPVYFGCYLGLVAPQQLKDLPENVNVAVFEEDLDGQDVVVYELTESDQHRKLRIYADPAIDYRYRQVESFYGGKLVQKIIAKDYQFFDGIAFPTFHEETTYSSDPNKPVRTRKTIQVENAEFNRDIDPNVFKIQFTTESIFAYPELCVRFKPCPDKSCKLGVEDILERVRAHRRK